MTEPTNAERAARAQTALQHYIEAKGEAFENSSTEIVDLIADLLHLAATTDQGDDPIDTTLRLARLHFDAEHDDPEESGNQHGLRCPECGKSDQLDIAATVWVRLCPDGTDVTAAECGDHEWDNTAPNQMLRLRPFRHRRRVRGAVMTSPVEKQVIRKS
ncbi:MAG: hypothetical protein ACHP78_12900 [Terriglobales bacterium]